MSIPCPLHRAPVTVFTPSRLKIVWRWQANSFCLAKSSAFTCTGFGVAAYVWRVSRLGCSGRRSLHLGKFRVVLLLGQMRVLTSLALLLERTRTILQELYAV